MKLISLIIISIFISNCYGVTGNTKFLDFNNATKQLMNKIYNKGIPSQTIYCQAKFNKNKKILNINDYTSNKHITRKKLEWEHIVPAQDFGKNFVEWTYGDTACIEKAISGRACANSLNNNYKYMQADLYNIYPAIGFINAKRSNFPFKDGDTRVTQIMSFAESFINDKKSEFNTCSVVIENKSIIPPNYAKGVIARTYLYMASTYRKYRLTNQQKRLFKKWNESYPVTKDECHRAKLISKLQGNHNKIVQKLCKKQKLYK